ncbi:MAG: M20/M25/M40 family metallo-hydrolase [Clostridia bacterium]|nr:M20/M25/M40 family metallo-hydrolase [Clostridia bacterium]
METYEILKALTDKQGVSGFEGDISSFAAEMLFPFCDEVYGNRFKSVIGFKKSQNKNAKKLMIEAHLDQIGLMVSKFKGDGFLEFLAVGGVDSRILQGSEVIILGKEKVYGIIGAKPPHLSSKEDKDKVPKISEMVIDTGLNEKELKEKISVGDSIVFKSGLTKLLGNACFSSAMDNRAGVAAILKAAEKISSSPYDLYFAFASEEEVGLHGAYTLAEEIRPDLAVVIDVTHGMTPDAKDETGVFKTGCGAVIGRGPNFDGKFTDEIIKIAKEKNIKYEIEVASGNSGTDAWAIQNSFGGAKTALISIPVKYMHTSVETLDLGDVEAVSDLIKNIAEVEINA